MIKAERLKKGDKVAIVSLSDGIMGEENLIHKYYLGKNRLEEIWGLKVVAMPNALMGYEYIYNHPEKRAEDLMNAFKDESIKAIICAIGGDDTIRLLPFIDYEVIKNNPKIFLGYSDSTINHLMMYKAGLVSFYGPSLMTDFAEYVEMPEYTVKELTEILFEPKHDHSIPKCNYRADERIEWCEENKEKQKPRVIDNKGYEIIQGTGIVKGKLIGGCIDLFPMCIGTEIWPNIEEWKNKILFVETSEKKIEPYLLEYYLRNLGAQGILNVISGVIVGKPQHEKFYEEYKNSYTKIFKEYNRNDVPIIYNVNIGHSAPICVLPYGIDCEINCLDKSITLLENAVN